MPSTLVLKYIDKPQEQQARSIGDRDRWSRIFCINTSTSTTSPVHLLDYLEYRFSYGLALLLTHFVILQ